MGELSLANDYGLAGIIIFLIYLEDYNLNNKVHKLNSASLASAARISLKHIRKKQFSFGTVL